MQAGVFTRSAWFVCLVATPLVGCQLPEEAPAKAPPSNSVVPPSSGMPAPSEPPPPLPPEETPSPEPPATAPTEAKPVEPGIAPTGAPTRGKLPKAVVDEKLKSAAPAIQACYERGLKAKPTLRGNVDIAFVVAPDGKVAHASAAGGDGALDDATTVDCILGEIRKLTFPEPSGGRVFLNYPLHFEPPKPATP
jgi:hypothetical protein